MRGGYLLITLLIFLLLGTVFIFGKVALKKSEVVTNTNTLLTAALPIITEPRVTIIDPIRGNPEARVTIVEFGDYFCEFCREMEPVLREVLATYPTEVRLVWKDFPNDYLHGQASRAAAAARCAGEQNKYWEFHDAIFERQLGAITSYEDIAAQIGLDRQKLGACLSSGQMDPVVQATSLEAQALKITGVPFFFLNSHPFEGTTIAELKTAINALLK